MITAQVERITPDIARKMLDVNLDRNRHLSKSHVDRLAAEMAGGRWQTTHQGIAFDDRGRLIDGQHRLSAIVKANVTVDMLVTRGVEADKNGLLVMDIGMKRSVADTMKMTGAAPVYSSNAMIAMLNAFFRFRVGVARPLSSAEVHDYITRYRPYIDKAYNLHNSVKGKRPQAVMMAAIWVALLNGENEDALKAFVRCYSSNVLSDLYACKHALDLRDYLARNAAHGGTIEVELHCEAAIYAFIHNRARLAADKYEVTALMI